MSHLDPDARAIIEAGRDGDDPTAADRARVRRALQQALAAGGTIAAGSTASSAKAAGAVGAKALLSATSAKIAAIVGVIGLGGAVAVGLSEGPRPVPNRLSAPPPAAVMTALPVEAPAALPPEAPAAVEAPAGPVVEAPATAKPAAPAPVPPRSPALLGSSRVEPPLVDPLESETRRLRDAHSALQNGEAERALEVLNGPGAADEGGQLREEREATRILALCKLGRIAEADAARARFFRDYPRSPLADRVRSACASQP